MIIEQFEKSIEAYENIGKELKLVYDKENNRIYYNEKITMAKDFIEFYDYLIEHKYKPQLNDIRLLKVKG